MLEIDIIQKETLVSIHSLKYGAYLVFQHNEEELYQLVRKTEDISQGYVVKMSALNTVLIYNLRLGKLEVVKGITLCKPCRVRSNLQIEIL